MVGQHVVRVAAVHLGVGVHQRGGQPGERVQQVVLGADRDLVGLDGADAGVDDDLAFGAELVADPAQPDLADPQHPGGGAQGRSAWSTSAGSTASISRR